MSSCTFDICAKPYSANGELILLNCDWFYEMGCRVEELEKSINELRAEMGAEGSPSPLAPSKSKPEEVKPDD
ncbi:hypothetical protein ACLOJK_026157 [Asimina triloba]